MKRSRDCMAEKTAVLTGAGGFAGRYVIDGLLHAGWTVTAISSDRHAFSRKPGLKTVFIDWEKTDWEEIFRKIETPALWVHAAAKVDFGTGDLPGLYQSNSLLTERLAGFAAQKHPSSRFIYFSSVSVYGKKQNLSLSAAPEPDTHYGISKLIGETAVLHHLKSRAVCLRLAGVYGTEPSAAPKLFINRCLSSARKGKDFSVSGSGRGKRNYLWAGDLAALVLAAYQKKWTGIRLAAGPENLSIQEMADAIAARFGVRALYTPSETPETDMLVQSSQGMPALTPFEKALSREAELRV